MNELVSVVIPTYKGAAKLARAIDSVVNSTYKNIELIIVDDNDPNTDERYNTEKIVESYKLNKLKYLKHEKNMNGSVARNTGIRNAEGKYVTFLDDDDYLLPERIEKSIKALKENNKNAFFSAVCVVRAGYDYKIVSLPNEITSKDILLNDLIIGTGSNLFLEKELVDSLNGFDESFERYQDREFLIRLCQKAKILISKDVLIVKSMNGQNNIPNVYKMKSVEEKFLRKFEAEYNNLEEKDKVRYINKKNHRMFELALESKDKKEIEETYSILRKSKELTLYEIAGYWLEKNKYIDEKKIKKIMVYLSRKMRNVISMRKVKNNTYLWEFIRCMEEY